MRKYYNVMDDIQKFPDAWCIVAYSKRGVGKTYGALYEAYKNAIPIIYMKRTNDDVAFICREVHDNYDTSPYYPVNRDKGIDVYPKLIDNGVGGFWHYEDGVPDGLPVAYALSMNAVKRVKGFDASRCDWLLFDEFIPQLGERIRRTEGDELLDLYMTVSRDRQDRGRPPLKLILFANSEEISTPITNTLEIVDEIADLNASGDSYRYLAEKGILIHHVNEYEISEAEKVGIYQAMKDTAWGKKAFEGEFARNDFTNVIRCNLKGYKCVVHITYKRHDYYIYYNDNGNYYMTTSRGQCEVHYNLDRENEQRAFYLNWQIDLREAITEDRMKFQKYSMYDLIKNYKQIFNLGRW